MRVVLIIISICIKTLVLAQGFKTRHAMPNCSDNTSKMIYEVSPGNYIAGGYSVDNTGGPAVNKLVLLGINNSGQVQWTKKYGTLNLEYLNNAFIRRCFYKQGNNLYYAGCMRDSLGRYIGTLVKFDLNGDTIWQRYYRDIDPLEDVIPQMAGSSVDGGFFITGFFQNNGSNPYNKCMVIKTNANGNELWRKKIGPNTQDGRVIIQDSASKKIVIAGYQAWGSNLSDNIIVLDSIGNVLQHSSFVDGFAYDMIQTSDKKFVVAGIHYYPQTIGGNNLMKSYVVKFDLNSLTVPIWRIDGFDKLSLNNGFCSLTEFKNSDIFLAGFIDTMQMHNLPVDGQNRFTKIDANGNIKWNRYYSYRNVSPSTDYAEIIATTDATSDGGWVASMKGQGTSVNPFFFVKYDSTGCDSSFSYCATLNPVGITKFKTLQPTFQLSPNPMSAQVSVTSFYELDELRFFDVNGKEIVKIIRQDSRELYVGDLLKGLYFVVAYKDRQVVGSTKVIKE